MYDWIVEALGLSPNQLNCQTVEPSLYQLFTKRYDSRRSPRTHSETDPNSTQLNCQVGLSRVVWLGHNVTEVQYLLWAPIVGCIRAV